MLTAASLPLGSVVVQRAKGVNMRNFDFIEGSLARCFPLPVACSPLWQTCRSGGPPHEYTCSPFGEARTLVEAKLVLVSSFMRVICRPRGVSRQRLKGDGQGIIGRGMLQVWFRKEAYLSCALLLGLAQDWGGGAHGQSRVAKQKRCAPGQACNLVSASRRR